MAEQTRYNGWKNWQTWNVALWIGNDEGLYRLARECKTFAAFKQALASFGGRIATHTPDDVAWDSSRVSKREINSMFREISE
jgi:hypothetical protein